MKKTVGLYNLKVLIWIFYINFWCQIVKNPEFFMKKMNVLEVLVYVEQN